MKRLPSIVGTMLLLAAAMTAARAELLVGWNFAGYPANPIPTEAPSVYSATGMNTSTATRGIGLVATGGTNGFSANSWTMPLTSTIADAVNSNDYFSFVISALPGNTFSVTNFSARMTRSSTGPSNFVLRSSADNFSSDLISIVHTGDVARNHSAALNLTGLTSVEFRLYGFAASAAAGTARFTDGADFGQTGIDLAIFGEVTGGPPPPPSTNVQFAVASATVGEAVGIYAVTLTKSLPSGNVSGSIALSGSATLGADYTIDTTNFVMNGAVTTATFVLTVIDDSGAEPPETVVLTIASVAGGSVGSPSSFTLTITDNDAPPPPPPSTLPTNIITYQRFEAGDPWPVVQGAEYVSSNPGASDYPPNQRIQEGQNSWQVVGATATLRLAQVSITGYTNRLIRARVSSTSVTSGNGADAGDYVRFFVALDTDVIPANFTVSLTGTNNARWGYWATNVIDVLAGTSNSFRGTAGLSSNNYATVIIRIPDAATSLALRVEALNDNTNEIWNLDNIEVLGDVDTSSSPYSPAQQAWIISYWGSLGAYTGDAADDDSDGYSNVEEFVAGTIPVPPGGAASFFRAVAITNAAPRFVVVPTVTGRVYRLWATPALAPSQSWSQVGSPVSGTGANVSIGDGTTTNFRAYRLSVELETP